MIRHTYTEAEAPRNTGSVTRPARFNMRLTCSARARMHKAFAAVRELTEMEKGATFADIWEAIVLPAVERVVRRLKRRANRRTGRESGDGGAAVGCLGGRESAKNGGKCETSERRVGK